MEHDRHPNLEELQVKMDERKADIRSALGNTMLDGTMMLIGFGTVVAGALIAQKGDTAGGMAVSSFGIPYFVAFATDMKHEFRDLSEFTQQKAVLQQQLAEIS